MTEGGVTNEIKGEQIFLGMGIAFLLIYLLNLFVLEVMYFLRVPLRGYYTESFVLFVVNIYYKLTAISPRRTPDAGVNCYHEGEVFIEIVSF